MTSTSGAEVRLRPALLILAAAVVALHPVLRNGLLNVTFDDGGFIVDNPYLGPWSWQNAWSCVSRFYLHDYLPLPMLSYLLEFQFWGFEPLGYHLVNLLLHVATAIAVFFFVRRALGSETAALWAAMVFVLHPVQLESVSLVAQRKTLMATGFVVAALCAYQLYCDGRRRAYLCAVLLYLLACGSKSSVVPFPALLVLYDRVFVRDKPRWLDKLPFAVLAAATLVLSVLSKLDGPVKAPQGGGYLATALVMSRVMWEYLGAMLLPVDLAPSYYYSPSTVFSPINAVALAALIAAVIILALNWRRVPRTAFFVGWAALSLLPVANIVPIAVVRADRYLYLPMVGYALWAGYGLANLSAGSRRRAAWLWPVPYLACAVLAVMSWNYAAVWHDDVAAWERSVDRQPWNARAHFMLAHAFAGQARWPAARAALDRSLEIDPQFDRAREMLQQIEGNDGSAASQAHQAGATGLPR